MDSAFSLLDDLDRLLFSFSADSGESQVGLVLLPFLEKSGAKIVHFVELKRLFFQNRLLEFGGTILILPAFGFQNHLMIVDDVVLKKHSFTHQNTIK